MTERDERPLDLDPRASWALQAFREDDDMPAATRARVWERVEASAASPAARRGLSPGTWAVLLLAAAALVLVASRVDVLSPRVAERGGSAAAHAREGEAGGAASVQVRGAARAEEGPKPASEAPAPKAEAGQSPVAAEREAGDVRGPSRSGGGRGGAAKASAAGSAAPAADDLAAEAEALARAQAALAGGRPQEALAVLSEYARRFPRGVLREEHDALRAIALCASGSQESGKEAAVDFLRERAASALAERVRTACEV